jgi:uncharacterized short protein YbdD (DUF466 family)
MSPHHHCCVHSGSPVDRPALQPPAAPVPTTASAHLPWWRQVIAFLRRWSGDDAYERYLADHRGHGHALLSRREFYKRYLDRRAGGSRCC